MNESELDEYLIAMNRAFRLLTAGPDRILAQQKLGRAHHRALFAIRREAGLTVGRLAGLLGVTNQALHKTLTPLLDENLIRMQASTDDARVKCLYLSAAGKRLEEKISGMQRDVFRTIADEVGRRATDQWLSVTTLIAERSKAPDQS